MLYFEINEFYLGSTAQFWPLQNHLNIFEMEEASYSHKDIKS